MATTEPPTAVHDLRVTVACAAAEAEENGNVVRIFPGGRRAHGEGTGPCIEIALGDGDIRALTLERPLYCNDQIYLAYRAGSLFVTDLFAAALHWLPVAERMVSDPQLIDHMLFRTVPGRHTLVDSIRRLGQGETLAWTRDRGWISVDTRLPDGVTPRPTPEQSLAQVDAALAAAAEPRAGDACLFSGGVDSTLLQCYLGPDVDAVTVVIDSPEFAPELDYARKSRELTRARGQEVRYSETEYRTKLEATISSLAMPPHHLQTVTIGEAYRTDHARYHAAQFADALFGLGFAAHADAVWSLRFARHLAGLGGLIRGSVGRRFATLQRSLAALQRPASDLGSFAQGFALYTDLDGVRSIFGRQAVDERLNARTEYTLSRVPASFEDARPGLAANLELGHWLDFFCDDTIALWGQLALARGKRLVAPFTHPEVVQAALRIPSPDRYTRERETKFWLKQLLQPKLPQYPTSQPKYSSGLPFVRYYERGPLRHALRDFSRPGFISVEQWEEIDARPTWLTWNVLTYLIWDRQVRGRQLPELPTPATLERRFSATAPSSG